MVCFEGKLNVSFKGQTNIYFFVQKDIGRDPMVSFV